MNAWQLVESGHYPEAVSAFSEIIRTNRPATGHFNNRGMAYLLLGDYDAALADFVAAEEVLTSLVHTACAGEMCGVAHWMARRETKAVETWSAGVEASLAGLVGYGDAAGGVSVGNLLLFGGVRLRDESSVALARRLLHEKLTKKESKAWPGPVSRYLLDNLSDAQMFSSVCNVPILRERQLCQAHFYFGVQALSRGDEDEYLDAIREACAFGRVSTLENEYYLSLHESRVFKPRGD